MPPQSNPSQAAEYRFSYGGKVLGAGPGSLWLEEREGRIKVLDMKVNPGTYWGNLANSVIRACQMMVLTVSGHASVKCVNGLILPGRRVVKSSFIVALVFREVQL